MITQNRYYRLPNKNHDVVDDINDLRSTFVMIDDDVKNTEEKIEALSETVSDLENRSVHLPYAVENSEIQNISANRYLVVNSDGDGFECLDGGGDVGGKLGQCSIKKTNENFDTAWGNILDVSKNGMTIQENSETSRANETHIFKDEIEIENEQQLPKVELTNCQAKSDLDSENNSSVIFCDDAEEIEEQIQIATCENFGLVKIGDGFSNDAGTISTQVILKATEEDFGIVKVGDGLQNNNGMISRDEINPATFSNFGVIKLGGNLSINQSGEMEIGDMTTAATIYNLGNVKIVQKGIVDLEEQTLQYRMFITEDLVVQFKAAFDPQSDFSFVLEIVSDGTHLISFNENLNPKISPLPINRGITKFTFSKKLGVPHYDVEISRLDAPEPMLLTPNYGDDINSNLMVTHNGADWNAHDMLKTTTNDMNFWGREFFFEFAILVVVDYVFCHFRYADRTIGEFWLKASNDKKNWTTLLYKNNETINGNIQTGIKGCFRYFKLYLGWKDDNYPRGFQLWGTQIDNNESELVLLTPYMTSNETGFAKLTYSNLHENGASQLTDADANSYIYVKYSEDTTDLFRWIKYEFPEAVLANLIDIAAFRDNLERTMRWYKLEGSNDDETWTLLLERQYQRDFTGDETRWHEFENTTAYKYYKLTCKSTNGDQYWRISRFRLFRKEFGKHNFYRGIPKLSSANQDGYEILASTQFANDHAGYFAFDDNTQTRWATTANSGDAWLQIKLPTSTAFNAVQIASRGDSSLDQAPSAFQIQGSNDGETWNTLDSESNVSWTTLGELKLFTFENENAYLYYRLYITANQGSAYHGCSCFILGNSIHEYKRWLNKYNNVVPTMTSDETIGEDGVYRLSSSTEHSDHKRKYLFDKRFDTRFELNGETSGWIQIELPVAKFVNLFSVGARSDGWCVAAPRNYTLLGSNNGTTWTQLFSISNSNTFSASELRTHELMHTASYKFYRLNISNPDSSVLTFARWDLVLKEVIKEY